MLYKWQKAQWINCSVLRTYTYMLWRVRLCYRSAFAFWLYKSARNLKFEVSAEGKLYVYVETVATEETNEIDPKKDVK
jgi:hypothetical protein